MDIYKKIVFAAFLASFLLANVLAASPKRGLAANDDIPIEDFGGDGSQVNWQYNWDSTTTNKQSFAEYVPLLWGTTSDHTAVWNDHVTSWLTNGSSHLLAFNEPERSDQSNLSPAAAADAFRQYMQPFAGKAKLGAPSVSNDGYEWLTKFLAHCSDCTIDFLPIHWYNPASMMNDLKNWTTSICSIVGSRPVWLTEFEATEGTGDEVTAFMNEAITFLDGQPCVERYAYFGTADASKALLANGMGPALSALGTQYAFTPFRGKGTDDAGELVRDGTEKGTTEGTEGAGGSPAVAGGVGNATA